MTWISHRLPERGQATLSVAAGRALVRLVFSVVLLMTASAGATVGCLPNENYEAHDFHGAVYGEQSFSASLGIHQIAIERTGRGWSLQVSRAPGLALPIKVMAGEPGSAATVHISASDFLTPDATATVRSRLMRRFVFGRSAVDPVSNPELLVPGGPASGAVNAPTVEPAEGDHGIGELFIDDMGVADLGPGKTPRLTYIAFRGCLGWDKGYRESDWRRHADPGMPDSAVSTMHQCGFDADRYRLSDRMTGGGEGGSAPFLEPDFLGNGIADAVVPVRRNRDGAMGLAVCLRPDNRLLMLGFDDDNDIGQFAEMAQYWRLNERSPTATSALPAPAGESIQLGLNQGPSLGVYLDATETAHSVRQKE